MQILKVNQLSEEWIEARKGKITGSTLKDVLTKRGNSRKVGFYQLIADRLALVDELQEDDRERGKRLEQEAADKFSQEYKLELEQDGLWISDENPNMAVSPDRVILDGKTRTAAVEIKCLSSARHLQIVIEDKVPSDFQDQVVQYFIVNEDLKTLYFVSYDPRVASKPMHVIEVSREDVAQLVEDYKAAQTALLAEVDEWVERLAF